MTSVPEALELFKPASTIEEELKVFQFVEDWEHPDWGRCLFANEQFITMLTTYPPGAHRCNDMWKNGWEIYVQPTVYRSKDFNNGSNSYYTTYKRRTLK